MDTVATVEPGTKKSVYRDICNWMPHWKRLFQTLGHPKRLTNCSAWKDCYTLHCQHGRIQIIRIDTERGSHGKITVLGDFTKDHEYVQNVPIDVYLSWFEGRGDVSNVSAR